MLDQNLIVESLKSRLRNFKVKNSGKLYSASCPVCGDSKKRKHLGRFFIIKGNGGHYRVHCHNCSYSTSILNFVKNYYYDIWSTWKISSFKEDLKYQSTPNISKNIKPSENIVDLGLLDQLMVRVDKLSDDHPAKQYVNNRRIPENRYHLLYYIDDFSRITELRPKYLESKIIAEPRLVLPHFNARGQLTTINARYLGECPEYRLRYILIDIIGGCDRVFGLERHSREDLTYVVEGSFDSLFLPNSLAICTSDLSKVGNYVEKKNSVLIFDNQYRNKEVVKLMRRACNKGYKQVIWPENVNGKDINEMILNGMTIDDIMKIIEANTFSGLSLELELTKRVKI